MQVKKTVGGETVEILAADDFLGIPVTISGSSPVKAGMPVTLAGAAAPDGTGAAGILLYDVDPVVNPNATLVVNGIVDWKKCQEHGGATASAADMKAILPGITFRENIGANA